MQFNYKLTKYDISINEWAGVVQVKNMKPVWEFLYTLYTYNLLSSKLYSTTIDKPSMTFQSLSGLHNANRYDPLIKIEPDMLFTFANDVGVSFTIGK